MSKYLIILFSLVNLIIGTLFIIPGSVLAMNIESTYDQEHFWFRDDDGSETTATGYGTGDLAVDAVVGASETFAVGQAFRLRVGLLKNNNGDLSLTQTPKLQFKAGATNCTDATGWTDVPTQTSCSSNAFCQATSTNFADGTSTTRQLDAVHTLVGGDMIETDGSPNSVTFGTGSSTDHAEWEWMLDSDNAATGTIYTFRIVKSDGTAFGTYTTCPTLETDSVATPTFTLSNYRWYVDSDTIDPTNVWGNPDIAQNTAITIIPTSNDPPSSSQELRLRVNFTVNTINLPASDQQFKLQFRTGTDTDCTTGTWTDVAAVASSAWQFATSSVTDGTTLTTNKLTSDVLEVYAKSNPTTTNPNGATTGQTIEYDFHLIGSGTDFASATQYLFRAIESDDTVFDGYTNCPTLQTEPGVENLLRHGNVFSGGSESGFFWAD